MNKNFNNQVYIIAEVGINHEGSVKKCSDMIKAASCGRPIIATDVPGCREIVHNGKNGILVPLKDSIALASAIKELINNSEKRRRMGINGRRLVVSEFSEKIVVSQTLKLYKKVLA
jgi:glycosyltransferase involved in cell wall biosynthesis